MRKILVIGAGRSSSALIHYLLSHSPGMNTQVVVADYSLDLAKQKVGNHERGKAVQFDVYNEAQRSELISTAEVVVSLLPADLHFLVARDCLAHRKHLVTASYISKDMATLDDAAKAAGLLFLNEIGVDPGIDHMSAMEIIHRIQRQGGKLTGFWSYCGGLIAPESSNLWGYKFTWAPRNVILAGQATALFLENGKIRYRNYARMFSEITSIEVPGHGKYEAYANRDSMKYLPLYGLEGIQTLFRGTLRFPGYCKLWNTFVQLGLTDDTVQMSNSEGMTWCDFLFSFVPRIPGQIDEQSLKQYLGNGADDVMEKITRLDLLSDRKITLRNATPAQALQQILEEKWKLEASDIDLLVMQHQFEYELGGKRMRLTSSMVDKGDDTVMTAMAKTVGWPMAIATRLLLEGKIKRTGVIIPIYEDIYKPVLSELHKLGIRFTEQEETLG